MGTLLCFPMIIFAEGNTFRTSCLAFPMRKPFLKGIYHLLLEQKIFSNKI